MNYAEHVKEREYYGDRMQKVDYCNYYGRLEGELKGNNLGVHFVDEAFKRIIDKHDEDLKKKNLKLINEVKKMFIEDIKRFTELVEGMEKRIRCLEKINKDLEKEKEEEEKEEKKKAKK